MSKETLNIKDGDDPRDGVGEADGAGRPEGFFRRVADLYAGGFREMTVGRRLWVLILVKLAIMFLVFRLFFFPDRLAEEYDNDADRARAVRKSLTTPLPAASENEENINLLQNP